MSWRAANSLLVLHQQLKAGSRATPPATDPDEWGLIGDTAHGSTSDHTPKDFPGWGNDIVTAADFPNRPDLGLDAHKVLDDIRRSRDPRAKYGISNGQIFSNHSVIEGGRFYPAWTWRPYNPSNGDRHYTHGHLSVVGDSRADGTQPWQTIGAPRGVAGQEDDDLNALMRYDKDPTGAVFLTDGKTARWVQTQDELNDRVTLHNDGTLRLGYNGQVRVVGRRSLIGEIIGEVPPWWVDGGGGVITDPLDPGPVELQGD